MPNPRLLSASETHIYLKGQDEVGSCRNGEAGHSQPPVSTRSPPMHSMHIAYKRSDKEEKQRQQNNSDIYIREREREIEHKAAVRRGLARCVSGSTMLSVCTGAY